MVRPVIPPHGLSHEQRSALTDRLLRRAHDAGEPERGELLEEVVAINLRVAHAVAARYRDRGVPLEDLEQAAAVGLVKAVSHFDATLRHDLLSYAVPTMRGEVQRYFRDLGWTVRPPRRVQDLQWRVNQVLDELSFEMGREPSTAEICERLGVTRQEYDEVVGAFGCFQPTSLDQPVSGTDGDLTVGHSLPDETVTDDAVEARTVLAPVVRRLSERDRRILYLRFFEDQTQREIGEEFGVPQMQVSRWLTRIYRDLRDKLDDSQPSPA